MNENAGSYSLAMLVAAASESEHILAPDMLNTFNSFDANNNLVDFQTK